MELQGRGRGAAREGKSRMALILLEFAATTAAVTMYVSAVGYDKLSVTGCDDKPATAEHDKATG